MFFVSVPLPIDTAGINQYFEIIAILIQYLDTCTPLLIGVFLEKGR